MGKNHDIIWWEANFIKTVSQLINQLIRSKVEYILN